MNRFLRYKLTDFVQVSDLVTQFIDFWVSNAKVMGLNLRDLTVTRITLNHFEIKASAKQVYSVHELLVKLLSN